jgi:hypothetical protein
MKIPSNTIGSLVTGQTAGPEKTEEKKTAAPAQERKMPTKEELWGDPEKHKKYGNQLREELRNQTFQEDYIRQKMIDYGNAQKNKKPHPGKELYNEGGIRVVKDEKTGKRIVEGPGPRIVTANDKGERFEVRVDSKHRMIRLKYNEDGSVSVKQIPGKDWRERVKNFYIEAEGKYTVSK